MHLSEIDIKNMEKVRRLNIVNALPGIKTANLVGTISSTGKTNLAIFSSVLHLGSNPALMGFILRPTGDVPRHTYENIRENGFFTINHVSRDFVEKAHYTSAKFSEGQSEFAACQLTEEYIEEFKAPFVKESQLKIGLEFIQQIPIEINGTSLIIGKIKHVILPDDAIDEKGYVNLELLGDTGISGLNSYYELTKIAEFPYARAEELPVF